jgi:hypothetical protein
MPASPAAARASYSAGTTCLYEMAEFAGFAKGAQRYIRRSLDVGLQRRDDVSRWVRSPAEAAEIDAQARLYRRLDGIRSLIPDDSDFAAAEPLLAQLVTLIAFDLAQGRLTCFASCRFLYERLVDARIRPWLPAAFLAAAALPHLHPDRRRSLLRSITETAATAPGWSNREPNFLPEWVEKVETAD